MHPQPSPRRRRLGRSHSHGRDDTPPRLRAWHAPRANRWELLEIESGQLLVEWLGAAGIRSESLGEGAQRWIAPGERWRVAGMDEACRFALSIHADEASAAAAPLPLRARILDLAPQLRADDATALVRALAALQPAAPPCIAWGGFDFTPVVRDALQNDDGSMCWHPLRLQHGASVALFARAPERIGLHAYLARDHAVIEAALAGALRDDVTRLAWLRFVLARHLAIEEELLFPAYLAAGGQRGWVRGLCNEHRRMAQELGHLHDAASRRRLLLLLDGHDEKEERIVYPDLCSRLEPLAPALVRHAVAMGAARTGLLALEGFPPAIA